MPKPPTRSQLIDEFAELDRLMKLYKPQVDRHTALKKELISWGDGLAAHLGPHFDSGDFRLELSPRKNKSWITDSFQVFKRMGSKAFVAAATITLDAVRTAGYHDLIETDRIGSREIVSVVPLASFVST